MFGLSGFEVAIIILFAFLIFGPDKLPDIARTAGRAIRQFRSAQDQMNKVIKAEVMDPVKDLEPLVNPFAGFSLDFLDGNANKDDATKSSATKSPATKSPALKVEGSSKGGTTAGTTVAASAAVAENASGEPLSNEGVQAALAADAEKAKRRALRNAANRTANSTTITDSFAERRARLEREHAKAKAEAEANAAKAEAAGEAEVKATDAEPAADAGAVKGSATQPEGSDVRKEDEKGN